MKTRGEGPVTGFQIAGATGKYVWATAKIDGATVLVSSPNDFDPRYVRYAWDYNPDANLVNAAGCPRRPSARTRTTSGERPRTPS